MPKGLPADQAAIWARLAPHAIAARTLTPATAEAFEIGCRVMALERKVASTPGQAGRPDHRGLLMQISAFLTRFRLNPMGKEMAADDPPADEWQEFDQPLMLVKGGK